MSLLASFFETRHNLSTILAKWSRDISRDHLKEWVVLNLLLVYTHLCVIYTPTVSKFECSWCPLLNKKFCMFKAAVLNIFLYNGSSKFLLFSFNDRIIGLKGGTVVYLKSYSTVIDILWVVFHSPCLAFLFPWIRPFLLSSFLPNRPFLSSFGWRSS